MHVFSAPYRVSANERRLFAYIYQDVVCLKKDSKYKRMSAYGLESAASVINDEIMVQVQCFQTWLGNKLR